MPIRYKGVSYVDATAPADFMAPAPTTPPVTIPTLDPSSTGPVGQIEPDGYTVHLGPDMYPPIGFDTPPDLWAAKRRNPSDLVVMKEVDVYRVLNIQTAKDMQAAMITWDADQLLKFERPVRTSLARALIDMALRYQRQPMGVWVKAVEDPDFFDRWRDERATVVLNDLTDSPDNLADGEPLPRDEEQQALLPEASEVEVAAPTEAVPEVAPPAEPIPTFATPPGVSAE